MYNVRIDMHDSTAFCIYIYICTYNYGNQSVWILKVVIPLCGIKIKSVQTQLPSFVYTKTFFNRLDHLQFHNPYFSKHIDQ